MTLSEITLTEGTKETVSVECRQFSRREKNRREEGVRGTRYEVVPSKEDAAIAPIKNFIITHE